MLKPPSSPRRSLSDAELYTPENITEALTKNLTTSANVGGSRSRLLELRRVQRFHAAIAELSNRIAYGLTLHPAERFWARLLIGPIQELRAMLAVDEAAAFFVRHAVLPAALSPSVSPAQRRTFLREMRALPFSEQGQPLSAFSESAQLLNPASFQRFNHAKS